MLCLGCYGCFQNVFIKERNIDTVFILLYFAVSVLCDFYAR